MSAFVSGSVTQTDGLVPTTRFTMWTVVPNNPWQWSVFRDGQAVKLRCVSLTGRGVDELTIDLESLPEVLRVLAECGDEIKSQVNS